MTTRKRSPYDRSQIVWRRGARRPWVLESISSAARRRGISVSKALRQAGLSPTWAWHVASGKVALRAAAMHRLAGVLNMPHQELFRSDAPSTSPVAPVPKPPADIDSREQAAGVSRAPLDRARDAMFDAIRVALRDARACLRRADKVSLDRVADTTKKFYRVATFLARTEPP